MTPTRDESTLWHTACAGDADAFSQIYELHADAIYRYLFRRLGDWADAEDLTAVVFLEAYRRRARSTVVNGRIAPWLYGIATNVLRNRRRTLRRHRQALARISPATATPDFAAEAADRLTAEHEARALLAKVAGLPRAQRDVVALCLWQGLSYEDAAVALAVPIGTVRSRLSRARSALVEAPVAPFRDEGEVTP